MYRAAHAYLQTNLNTNSPGETVLMLYDGAVKFLNLAKDQIEARDYAKKGQSISKAMDIVNELSAVLNKEKGGDLADNLHKLYFWCNTRLAMANLKMDKDIIDSIIKVLSGLRDAFAQIQNQPEAQAVAEQIAARQGSSAAPQIRNMHTGLHAVPPATAGLNLRGHSLYSKMSQV